MSTQCFFAIEGIFPSKKGGNFMMLECLKKAGLNARLDHDTYDRYAKEIYRLEDKWKDSLDLFNFNDLNYMSCGIDTRFIPCSTNQDEYANIVYDHRECRVLEPGETLPSGYRTMADGGTIPCAISTLLEYFGQKIPVEEIGKILVQYNYRTPDKGTLWSAFERILEPIYGIETTIQSSIYDLFESVALGKPVVAMISPEILYKSNTRSFSGNEAIIIWRFEHGRAIISTTHLYGCHKVNAEKLLKNLLRAWACRLSK